MENYYHRYLKLPFEITKPPIFDTDPGNITHVDLTPRHSGQTEVEQSPWDDTEVREWIESLGLRLIHTEAFFTPPGQKIPIHTDDLDRDHIKINLTWGPEEGVTRWWNSDNQMQVQDTKHAFALLNGDTSLTEQMSRDMEDPDNDFSKNRDYSQTPFRIAREEESTLILERNTNTPSILNVGELHSTYNPTNEGRWTICFVPAYHREKTIENSSQLLVPSDRHENDSMLPFNEALEIFKDYVIEE